MNVYVITKETWDGGEEIVTEIIKVFSSLIKAEESKGKLEEDLEALKNEFCAKYPLGLFEDTSNFTKEEYVKYKKACNESDVLVYKVTFYIQEFELE